MLIADHHDGVDKAKRVGVALATNALGPSLGEAFEFVLQRQQTLEAGQDLVERLAAAGRVFVIAVDEDEGQACDLAGAFVDRLLEAVLGRGDLAFEGGAGLRRGFEFIAEGDDDFEQAVDEEARDFPEPGHGVQRKEDAQEGEEEFDHERKYAPGLAGWGFVVTNPRGDFWNRL
jgi:hypothetical protein